MTPSQRAEAGVTIRDARHARQLSQFRLAVLARVSPQSVALTERGAGSPAMLARLAKALKVKLPASNEAVAE